METQKITKKRLPGGKSTDVARQRYQLYRLAHERIKVAYEAGFYIECVAICESIITDRLEARLQFLSRNTTKLAPVLSLGHILKAIKKSSLETDPDLLAVYPAISVWADRRNAVVHQFVKLIDGDETACGDDRIEAGRKAAKVGMDLMRKIPSLVRKHNKWEAEA